MTTAPGTRASKEAAQDHRIETAQKKRDQMRARILDATTRVFAQVVDDAPVIEDVVREAEISRGTFYKYFKSLDEALVAAGIAANESFMAEVIPVLASLKEPWQQAAVAFRLHLLRAAQHPSWAGFVTRMDAWPRYSTIATHMSKDIEKGRQLGQFHFDDTAVMADIIMGASAGCIQTLRRGVADPQKYIDAALRMTFQCLGCSADLQARAMAFSREYVAEWVDSERLFWKPR